MGSIDEGAMLDGRYRMTRRRAAGATAIVWEAEDEFLRRRVAIKILHEHLASDPDLLARFVAEARTAATVTHPALVAVYDSTADHPGIVLEWIEGPDLRQRLDQSPVPPAEVAELGAMLCAGLSALHDHGLIHRDIKPANILLTAQGLPKLTDFGIATANAGDRTATGVVLGTAKYLSPEQVRGDPLDGRSDIFALAAVLYEAIAGHPPWERDGDLPTALARLEGSPTDLRDMRPELAASLTAAVMKGLEREPADRWTSATAFARALRSPSALPAPPTRPIVTAARADTLANASPATAAPPPGPQREAASARTPVRPRRRWWPRIVGMGVMAAIALLGWTLVSATTRPDSGGAAAPTTDPFDVLSIAAFDPEGSGPPGEHNDRAGLAIDGDDTTAWPTESYEHRNLGAKSGVGLVLTLAAVEDINAITVHTRGSADWAADIYVSTSVAAADAASITAFGEPQGGARSAGSTATFVVAARGDTVVVWLTDLGTGPLPIRLSVAEVTIQ